MIPNCHETRVYVTGTVRRHGRESGTNALADLNTEEHSVRPSLGNTSQQVGSVRAKLKSHGATTACGSLKSVHPKLQPFTNHHYVDRAFGEVFQTTDTFWSFMGGKNSTI